jgi:benzoyl-CoA 2,3-epoxidase subunit B
VMKELGTEDPAVVRNAGAIDLQTVQKYMNFWFSSALDLFGSESSSNAGSYFANGIKGRPDEAKFADHREIDTVYSFVAPDGSGGIKTEEIAMRNAMNAVTRNEYVKDCEVGLKRWNKTIERAGYNFELKLPSDRFHRSIGVWSGVPTDLAGNPISKEAYEALCKSALPSAEDRTFVKSLQQRVVEPGKMAAWIAPPDRGINNLPVDYEYVRLN